MLEHQLTEPQLKEDERQRVVRRYNRIIAISEPTSLEWLRGADKRLRLVTAPPGGIATVSVGDLRAPIEG